MKQRMQSLINEMNKNIYEKDSEISLSLLAAISWWEYNSSWSSGSGKDEIETKSAFRNARSFEYLMSRFSNTRWHLVR